MFPVHAKCVTFEAGYEMERKKASEKLEIGRVYTIRTMQVHQSSTSLEFYEVPGKWNSAFFDAFDAYDDYTDLLDNDEPPGGNDPEAQ